MEIERLFVALALDSTEYSGGLQDATNEGTSWAKNWGSVVSGALSAAFLVGLAVVIAGLTAVGVAAFDIASDFDTAGKDIQAQLGTTAEESERLAEVAASAWGNNFGESVEEVTAVIIEARQQMGQLADDELQRVTENAFRLQDAFGIETAESIATAETLMGQFGLTSDEAFDFITAGYQNGLNSSDDFIDSINEYSNLYSDAGFSAEEMFSIMESGMADGVLGTDKISDAIKEFGIIMNEEGDGARDALGALGLDYDDMIDQVATGSATWADYFDDIVAGLQGVEDPLIRSQLQTELFGTMAEDLGVSFTDGLTSAGTALEDFSGKTEALDVQYQTLPAAIEGFKRRALLAIRPIGDLMLQLVNFVMPFVEQGFTQLEALVGPLIEQLVTAVQAFFTAFQAGQTPLNTVIDILTMLWNEVIIPLAQRINEVAGQFGGWGEILKTVGAIILASFIPTMVQIVAAVAIVIGIVALVVEAVSFLKTKWDEDWNGIRTTVTTVAQAIWDFIILVFTAVQTFWAEHGDAILAQAQMTWDAIMTAIQVVIDFISLAITTFFTAVQEFWDQHGEAITTAAQTAWETIETVIQTVLDTIQILWDAWNAAREGDWTTFGEKLRELWDMAWNNILTFFTEFLPTLLEKIQDLIDDVIERFNQTDWNAVGKSILDGIAEGIRNGVGVITEAAQNAAQAALDAAKGFLGISSPSSVMAQLVGRPITEGVAMGMMDTSPIMTAMSRISDTIQAGFTDSRRYDTTIQLAEGQDPGRAIRASRHLDQLQASGVTR